MYRWRLFFRRWLIFVPLFAIFLMSHNAFAAETDNMQYIGGSQPQLWTYGTNGNCSISLNDNIIANTNANLDCNVNWINMKIWERTYNQNEVLAFTFSVKTPNASVSSHSTINLFKTTTSGMQVIGQSYEQLNTNTGIVTVFVKVWTTQTYNAIAFYSLNTYELFKLTNSGNTSGAEFDIGYMNIFIPTASQQGVINSVDSLGTKLDTIYTMENGWLGTIDSRLLVIVQQLQTANGHLADISGKLDGLEDIAESTENVSNYVDEQRQAYQNMQNTDGLIDVGNQDQALGIVGSINSFLGSITNTVSGNCVLPGDLGNVDMGDLDLCDAPQEVRNTVGTVGGIVLAVLDIFIAYHTIKYIIAFIDWARRN